MRRLARPLCRVFSSGAGILGIEVYIPPKYVCHRDLEVHDGAGEGKYTIGLGQQSFSFVDDREDSVSLMMNAMHNLLKKYEIDPSEVGALYVGTETAVDRSKSVKSYLMQLFDTSLSGNSNVEGVDNINACFGGTQSLWDACYWVESHKDLHDKYAVVVCGDCAGYKEPNARATSGAGAVAMLVGKNATLKLDIQKKFCHFDHVYDFYKPDPTCMYPMVEGHYSNACFLSSLDRCYTGGDFSLSDSDYVLFHSPYNKLIQKSLGFLGHVEEENSEGRGLESRLESYSDAQLLNESRVRFADIYEEKAAPGTRLPRVVGNSYTSSLYFSLASLLSDDSVEEKGLEDSQILMFSYGSGLASSMFQVECCEATEERFSLENIRRVLDIDDRLQNRVKFMPEQYVEMEARNFENFRNGMKSLEPRGSIECMQEGTFYLDSIDDVYRRSYAVK